MSLFSTYENQCKMLADFSLITIIHRLGGYLDTSIFLSDEKDRSVLSVQKMGR